MANLQWDHTVHYVNDLQAAIQQFKDNGLHAFIGGSHEHWGTHNALSYFDLCYVEFLGVEDRDVAESMHEPNDVVKDAVKLLPERETFGRVALRTDDIKRVASHLHNHDLALSPIMDGKRLDAQRHLIEWRMLTINGNFQGLPYPFIIQWNETDQVRREKLTETGSIQQHPAGDVSIEQAIFRVERPLLAAQVWHELFGFPIVDKTDTGATLEVGKQEFVFQKGEDNHLEQLVFDTDDSSLKGKTMRVGKGEYVF